MKTEMPGPMTPFDELVTTPELQMLKLILPFAPSAGRQAIASCIKFLELKRTILLFQNGGFCALEHMGAGIAAQGTKEGASPPVFRMLESFRPYLRPEDAAALDQILSVREMMSVMEAFQDGPDGKGSMPEPADILSGMFSPEQQEMFRMYSEMFSPSPDGEEKGADGNGQRMDEQSGNEKYGPGEGGTDTDGG